MHASNLPAGGSRSLGLVLSGFLVASAVHAQALGHESEPEPVQSTTVTATRIPQDVRSSGSTVTVITRQQIESRQLRTLNDALRSVPGVDVVQSGGPGAVTSTFLRGTNSGQTLVLVDGVEINDPSDFSGAVQISDLGLEDVERIEVLRGPASSLYGSSAIGGVISIITRHGQGPLAVSLTGEGGSFDTFRQFATVAGAARGLTYAFSAAHVSTEGISQADARNGNAETDPYSRTRLSSRLAYALLPRLEVGVALGFTVSRLSYDGNRAGRPADDPNAVQDTRSLLARPYVRGSFWDGRWSQELSLAFFRNELSNDNAADLVDPSELHSRDLGRRWQVDWQNGLRLLAGNQLLLLLSGRDEAATARSRSLSSFGEFDSELPPISVSTLSATLEDEQRLFDALTVRAAGRFDRHALFGTAWTYTLAASYEVPVTRTAVRSSFGTAFTAPSLQQLRDPSFGNKKLKPERSHSFEAGVEQPFLAEHVRFGAALFTTDIRDLFSFDPTTFQSINVGSARITGVESFVQGSIPGLTLRLDHTWMHPLDRTTGQDLLRRPRNKLAATLDVGPFQRLTGSIRASWVGRRLDTDFSLSNPGPVELNAYLLVAVSVGYALTPAVQLTARVENLLDRRYSEVLGFGTPGVAGYGGVAIRL